MCKWIWVGRTECWIKFDIHIKLTLDLCSARNIAERFMFSNARFLDRFSVAAIIIDIIPKTTTASIATDAFRHKYSVPFVSVCRFSVPFADELQCLRNTYCVSSRLYEKCIDYRYNVIINCFFFPLSVSPSSPTPIPIEFLCAMCASLRRTHSCYRFVLVNLNRIFAIGKQNAWCLG